MTDQDYILFENYLLGDVSEEEKKTFEIRLEEDSKFKESFNTYKELSSYLEHTFENEDASKAFKANLQKISKVYFDKNKDSVKIEGSKNTYHFYKYAMAACVVLFLGIFMFNQFSNPSYADFAHYDTISLTVRGEQDALLKTAENAFNNKDFAKAEDAFSKLLKVDKDNSELKLYRAIANIELNHFETADALLFNLQEGQSVYKNKATWYLALSKLKQKQYAACLDILKTIPEDADNYKQVKNLINKLD
ncbi:tetratricopeptide repeat protein [Confluentibacter sediminis]|uniref:tetratricopeptide repeat protein n=1 Tax=Confluentibacter sediminis TaxID=2219045 RepID=UPI000DAD3C5B|nr:hypothetical protein [Confluentibacter sediminis]